MVWTTAKPVEAKAIKLLRQQHEETKQNPFNSDERKKEKESSKKVGQIGSKKIKGSK